MLKRAVPFALLLTALDQAAKWASLRFLASRADPVVVVPGFFDLRHMVNIGASFGWFSGWRFTLAAFAAAALALLVIFHKRVLPPGPLSAATLALLLGGIAGNLIDRARTGGVIDFIHLHWRQHSFPVFNIADTCITFGVGLHIAGQFLAGRTAKRGGRGGGTGEAARPRDGE